MRAYLLSIPLLALACSSRSAPSASSDASSSTDVLGDLGADSDKCCPLDASGCGCWPAGGARSKGCGDICDGDPRQVSITYDEEGCPVLHIGYGTCYGPPPDTGPFPSADVQSEASPECCPIADTPSCDCFATGGSPSQPGGCANICDAKPTAATKGVDEHGCPIWNVGPGSCLEPDAGPG